MELNQHRVLKKGFTVVEVLMMLGVIAVIVAIMAPSLNGRIREAEVVSLKSGLENVQKAILAYRADMTVYPSNLWELQALPTGGTESCGGGISSLVNNWKGPYIALDIVDTNNSPPQEVGLKGGGDWVMADKLVRNPATSSAGVPQATLSISIVEMPLKDATLLNTLIDGTVVPPLNAGQDTAGAVRWGAAVNGSVTSTYSFIIRQC